MTDLKLTRKAFIRRYRKFSMLLLMLFSLWVGYELASYETRSLQKTISTQVKTITALNDDNHRLVRQYNQENAKSLLCESELDTNRATLIELTHTISKCQEKVALYQHVIAPELSGDLLSVDLVALSAQQQIKGSYQLALMLLQPRLQKSVITGDLRVSVLYSEGEPPVLLENIAYRFKFFQQVSTTIVLPSDKEPLFLVFDSNVYQYKRLKEEFNFKVKWDPQ